MLNEVLLKKIRSNFTEEDADIIQKAVIVTDLKTLQRFYRVLRKMPEIDKDVKLLIPALKQLIEAEFECYALVNAGVCNHREVAGELTERGVPCLVLDILNFTFIAKSISELMKKNMCDNDFFSFVNLCYHW